MLAFDVLLQPSKQWMSCCLCLHLLAALVAGLFFHMTWLLLIWLFLLLGALWAWRGLSLRTKHAVVAIYIDAFGRATLVLSQGGRVKAMLMPDSRIGRWLLVLHWRDTNKHYRQLVLPDMTSHQSFRRLKVWAGWCQDKKLNHP